MLVTAINNVNKCLRIGTLNMAMQERERKRERVCVCVSPILHKETDFNDLTK